MCRNLCKRPETAPYGNDLLALASITTKVFCILDVHMPKSSHFSTSPLAVRDMRSDVSGRSEINKQQRFVSTRPARVLPGLRSYSP